MSCPFSVDDRLRDWGTEAASLLSPSTLYIGKHDLIDTVL